MLWSHLLLWEISLPRIIPHLFPCHPWCNSFWFCWLSFVHHLHRWSQIIAPISLKVFGRAPLLPVALLTAVIIKGFSEGGTPLKSCVFIILITANLPGLDPVINAWAILMSHTKLLPSFIVHHFLRHYTISARSAYVVRTAAHNCWYSVGTSNILPFKIPDIL